MRTLFLSALLLGSTALSVLAADKKPAPDAVELAALYYYAEQKQQDGEAPTAPEAGRRKRASGAGDRPGRVQKRHVAFPYTPRSGSTRVAPGKPYSG